jgi:hypothetical protein
LDLRCRKYGRMGKIIKEEIHNFYSSPNTISVIKSRRMRWVGHVAHIVEKT